MWHVLASEAMIKANTDKALSTIWFSHAVDHGVQVIDILHSSSTLRALSDFVKAFVSVCHRQASFV